MTPLTMPVEMLAHFDAHPEQYRPDVPAGAEVLTPLLGAVFVARDVPQSYGLPIVPLAEFDTDVLTRGWLRVGCLLHGPRPAVAEPVLVLTQNVGGARARPWLGVVTRLNPDGSLMVQDVDRFHPRDIGGVVGAVVSRWALLPEAWS